MLLTVCLSGTVMAQMAPKREFRGAWIQCVNGQFMGMGSAELQQTLTSQLDSLQKAGINAIIFQVRPEADALYQSDLEPWSRYLTGVQGQAPNPYWDPLQFMVEQCHSREMEIHAWINPYRAKTKGTTVLAGNHPAKLHPERFVAYDGLLCFDPGLPENRKYICKVVADIVGRYDVDGLHMDDYFYPYEPMGTQDNATYRRYAPKGMDIASWRRNNTDRLVLNLGQLIRKHNQDTGKSVRFGISPFGIWANITPPCPAEPAAMRRWQKLQCSPLGSETKGHQSHYELYANTRKWVKNNWIDYVIPQVYWGFSNPAAPFAAVVDWWAETVRGTQVTLYIGIGAYRMGVNEDCLSEDELSNQVIYCQKHPEIKGVSFFSSRSIFDAPPPVREAAFKTVFETLWGKKYTILR